MCSISGPSTVVLHQTTENGSFASFDTCVQCLSQSPLTNVGIQTIVHQHTARQHLVSLADLKMILVLPFLTISVSWVLVFGNCLQAAPR